MKRSQSAVIDEKATVLFHELVGPEWVINDLQGRNDYAKDFMVEIVTSGQLAGKNFFAQLKGTELLPIKGEGKYVSFQLETKHAVYYFDKAPLPVFLFVIDVETKSGYWQFMQQYLRDEVKNKKWRTNKSVAVRLPISNNLRDRERLQQAIVEAHEYLHSIQPGVAQAALKRKKIDLEKLDPRFQIQISATDKAEHYHLTPREQVTCNFTFNGVSIGEKIRELFGRGLPVDFSSGELTVSGSALLEEVFSGGGTIEMKLTGPVEVVLTPKNGTASLHIPAIAEGGLEEVRISGEMANSPIAVKTIYRRGMVKAEVSLGVFFPKWFGQPIRDLAYFNQIDAFIKSLSESKTFRLEVLVNGNRKLRANMEENTVFAHFAEAVEFFRKARRVAEVLGINPLMPSTLDNEQINEVELLYDVFETGFHEHPSSGTLTCTLSRVDVDSLLKQFDDGPAPIYIQPSQAQTVPFFGEQYETDRLFEYEYTDTIVATDKQVLLDHAANHPDEAFELVFKTTPTSRLICRRLPLESDDQNKKTAPK